MTRFHNAHIVRMAVLIVASSLPTARGVPQPPLMVLILAHGHGSQSAAGQRWWLFARLPSDCRSRSAIGCGGAQIHQTAAGGP